MDNFFDYIDKMILNTDKTLENAVFLNTYVYVLRVLLFCHACLVCLAYEYWVDTVLDSSGYV